MEQLASGARLTTRAQAVLDRMPAEARQFNHNYLGTEHLLLALLSTPSGVAARALTRLDVTADRVRQALGSLVGVGDAPQGGEQRDGDTIEPAMPVAPRLKQALAYAGREAARLGHAYLGTEHLLLGLLQETDGMAVVLLHELGVEPDEVRAQVLRLIDSAGPKGNVVTCRVDDRTLRALDALVEAGIRSTRSDAAAWLIHAGIDARHELFERVFATVDEIRRLRDEVRQAAQP